VLRLGRMHLKELACDDVYVARGMVQWRILLYLRCIFNDAFRIPADSREHGNEPSGSINSKEYLDWSSEYQLLKMDSVLWGVSNLQTKQWIALAEREGWYVLGSLHSQLQLSARISTFDYVRKEYYYLLEYNAVQPVESQLMFRRNTSSPSSGRISQARNLRLPPAFRLLSCSAYSSTLKMEAICSSETSVDIQRTTRRYKTVFFVTTAVRTSNPTTQENSVTSALSQSRNKQTLTSLLCLQPDEVRWGQVR
jgi:hypothetical protein